MFKTVIALRHVFFEDLSAFAPILAEAGYKIEYLDLGVDDLKTSKALEAELVVALGGPIGAYEENLYPYLKDEIDLLERRLTRGRPTKPQIFGPKKSDILTGLNKLNCMANQPALKLTRPGRDKLLDRELSICRGC
jgi:hypothetical protein